MGVLNRKEINERLKRGELLSNPRRKDGQFDIENDSYDLTAGTAVWKQASSNGDGPNVETVSYLREPLGVTQPTVTVQPGQMIFVVTHEDVLIPPDLCGTVYSRNSLALAGILALNAGHVDSGYEGPIVIRLINLRAMPWVLTLGDPIFTITFQTVASDSDDSSNNKRRVSQNEMLLRVRETATSALGNALYDLYSVNVDQRLSEFKTNALTDFKDVRDARWVQKEEIWSILLDVTWKKILAITIPSLIVASAVVAAIFAALTYFSD